MLSNIATEVAQLGVSSFLINFLRDNPKVETRVLVDAYSRYLNKDFKEVYNNVANALSRLKGQGRVDYDTNDTGRGEWFFIK